MRTCFCDSDRRVKLCRTLWALGGSAEDALDAEDEPGIIGEPQQDPCGNATGSRRRPPNLLHMRVGEVWREEGIRGANVRVRPRTMSFEASKTMKTMRYGAVAMMKAAVAAAAAWSLVLACAWAKRPFADATAAATTTSNHTLIDGCQIRPFPPMR